MENTNDILLEQLKKDYAQLKAQVNKQEILNDKLLSSVFKSKVKSIHSVGWVSALCGLFVVLIAPFVFHYNPVVNASWAFVAATEILMIFCMASTWYFHHGVSAPGPGESLLAFAENVKTLKVRYQNWTYIGLTLAAIWASWLCIEIFQHTEDKKFAICFIVGLLVGGALGGFLGLKMNKDVISNCDEIINAIEE